MIRERYKKWVQFIIGLTLIILSIMILPHVFHKNIQQQNEDMTIDAGALFYSDSPHALEKAYQLQKLKDKH